MHPILRRGRFLDTQVVSYAQSGARPIDVRNQLISSVVANEFLNAYSSNPTRANYYVTQQDSWLSGNPMSQHSLMGEHLSKTSVRKRLAAGLVIDFGNAFPTRIEFNRFGIADAINTRNRTTIRRAIEVSRVHNPRTILSRFDFLIDSNIHCHSLMEDDVRCAMSLLAAFTALFELKDDFLNSFNDLLILATAARWKAALHTEDSLLSRFVARQFGLSPLALNGLTSIDFAGTEPKHRRRALGSKGFINCAWRVHELRIRGPRR